MTEKLEKKIIELIDDYLIHGIRFDSHGILCDHHIETFEKLTEAIEHSGDSGRSAIAEAIDGIYINDTSVADAIKQLASVIESNGIDNRFFRDLIQAIKQAGKYSACNDKFSDVGK